MRGFGLVGGVLNPCGFVGCDLPCVQVMEPLLPLRPKTNTACYLFYTNHLPPPLHTVMGFFIPHHVGSVDGGV